MSKETISKMDIDPLTEMPISYFKGVMKFIAEHDLWDEVEKHLKDQRCVKLKISFEPIESVGRLLQKKVSSGTITPRMQVLASCGCNGPLGPRPGPTSPSPPHGPDGGGGGGDPPDGGGGGATGGGPDDPGGGPDDPLLR
jgi:hypothetical protein